ncbi:hypothetical protein A2V49_03830 [candidate division WWE3 bacterium RBG_19FT_COMBO_34_6]|uniref:Uncharacterized protein n=1 Tax=candidate division WWE3 bacterium RBG_19FT_COMBO_34_6 TaxID=1802612 RepID=A0A1F4UKU5_UNCKA|nr:MAG: hypothetical protein A2V49_03830 [candidate division WWE3 bacterium RBG_19FT_COMBO_34_6]
MKWSISFQKNRDESIPWNEKRSLEHLSGNLRGIVAEEISLELSPNAIETVFSSKDFSLKKLAIKLPQNFTDALTNRKGDVLGAALAHSLKEKPLEIFNKDKIDPRIKTQFDMELLKTGSPRLPAPEYYKKLNDYIEDLERGVAEDFMKNTWGKVKEKDSTITPAGEFYDQTTIPDAIIGNENNEMIGFIEVKAYTSDELAALLKLIRQRIEDHGSNSPHYEGTASNFGKNYPGAEKEKFTMGVDLDKEIKFLDTLRGLVNGEPDKDSDNLIILRFPNDIPDNLLMQYGELIVSYGYPNLVIQKLPYMVEELNVISKTLLGTQMQKLNYQLMKKMNFSDRELSVLEKYSKS